MSQYEDPRGEAAAVAAANPPATETTQDHQGAYISDYNNAENYSATDYAGSVGFGVDASANPWTQYADDSGIPYWCDHGDYT